MNEIDFIKLLNNIEILPILMGTKGIEDYAIEKRKEIELLIKKADYENKKRNIREKFENK